MCIFESKRSGKITPVDEEGNIVQVRLDSAVKYYTTISLFQYSLIW